MGVYGLRVSLVCDYLPDGSIQEMNERFISSFFSHLFFRMNCEKGSVTDVWKLTLRTQGVSHISDISTAIS